MKKATWNNYLAKTWDLYLPPIRPYNEELDIFKQYIVEFINNNKKLPNVLILGSTPEFRDILFEYNIIPTVIDFSKDNYEGMSLLINNKGIDKFIESNWLDVEKMLDETKFDFVFSEAAFNVLNKESAVKLYKIISNLLNKEGKLIAKEWIRFSNVRPNLNKIVKDYRSSNNSRGFYSHTCIPLMLLYYNFENEIIKLSDFSREIEILNNIDVITNKEWETIEIHEYNNVELELYIPKIQDFLNDMGKNFSLLNIHNIAKPNAQYHPIFVLEVK